MSSPISGKNKRNYASLGVEDSDDNSSKRAKTADKADAVAKRSDSPFKDLSDRGARWDRDLTLSSAGPSDPGIAIKFNEYQDTQPKQDKPQDPKEGSSQSMSQNGMLQAPQAELARPAPFFNNTLVEKLVKDASELVYARKFKEAAFCFKQACDLDRPNPINYYYLGLSHLGELGLALFKEPGEYDFERFRRNSFEANLVEAIKHLEIALSLCSEMALKLQIYFALAMAHSFTNEIDHKKKAIVFLRTAKELTTKSPLSLDLSFFLANMNFQYAVLLGQVGDFPSSLSELENIRNFYAKAYPKMAAEARQNGQEGAAVQKDPYDFNLAHAVVLRFAMCFYKMKKFDDSKKYLQSIINEQNSVANKKIVAEAYLYLGFLLSEEENGNSIKNREVRRDLCLTALKLDFNDDEIRCRLLIETGILCSSLGQVAEANEVLKKAGEINIDNQDVKALLQLGLTTLYYNQANYKQAKTEGEKGMSLCRANSPSSLVKSLCLILQKVYACLEEYLKAHDYQQRAKKF